MKEQIVINYDVLTYEQLSEEDKALVENAKKASLYSYAPFSQFYVGCAVLLENGVTITGNNQENASFPCGTCAERSTIFYAHSNYPDYAPVAIAITARQKDGEFIDTPLPACGACRQALLEMEQIYKRPLKVILYSTGKTFILHSIHDMLPLQFSATMMQ